MRRDAVTDVLRAWERGRNALLYGPPGTGKTRALGTLFDALRDRPETDPRAVDFDPLDAEHPLHRPRLEVPIPTPAKVVWTTFHQSYSYEDFILGLRPEAAGGAPILRPWLGVLLDSLYDLTSTDHRYQSVVLFIDEINRGNAARIFGEFMTFLDFDYRATTADGSENPRRLPMPLRQLRTEGAHSEEVLRIGGEAVRFGHPLYFPRHVYIVGTMNSVDRAAVPIDSALARRFDRIEMSPDLEVLASHFGVAWDTLDARAQRVRDDDGIEWPTTSPGECAILLLDRLNAMIAAELGPEFELGHGLLMTDTQGDIDRVWRELFLAWDDVVFPQLEDRFSGRPDHFRELLKVDSPPEGEYAWRPRQALGRLTYGDSLGDVKLMELDPALARRSLQWLSV